MHFDHCGGLPDFPQAEVHVHKQEYEAFLTGPRRFMELAYIKRDVAHERKWNLYESTGEKWFEFDAIRLPDFDASDLAYPTFWTFTWSLRCSDSNLIRAGTCIAVTPVWILRIILLRIG